MSAGSAGRGAARVHFRSTAAGCVVGDYTHRKEGEAGRGGGVSCGNHWWGCEDLGQQVFGKKVEFSLGTAEYTSNLPAVDSSPVRARVTCGSGS